MVARSAAPVVAPSLAGGRLSMPAHGLPFLAGGSIKLVYDSAVRTHSRNAVRRQ